jgi:hypothetical protein
MYNGGAIIANSNVAGMAPEILRFFCPRSGLPDFPSYNIPKREKYLPNYHKLYQMVTKHTK